MYYVPIITSSKYYSCQRDYLEKIRNTLHVRDNVLIIGVFVSHVSQAPVRQLMLEAEILVD